jgi:hypothetical protein
MDSRCYLFIFPIRGSDDIPADYPFAIKQLAFDTGVFLPQDESNWWTRPPRFPARLLLLAGRLLHIIPHPLSGEPPVAIPLDDLVQLETGTVLLFGWLKFVTAKEVLELRYNTRASRPLEIFLRDLKSRWISQQDPLKITHPQIYGEELDVKFRFEVSDEIRGEESIVLQYFRAPQQFEHRWFGFRRETGTAGHLLLVTSASRLLWVTDHYQNYRELYAAIRHNAPLSTLSDVRLAQEKEQLFLLLDFQAATSWCLPVEQKNEDWSLVRDNLRRLTAGRRKESTRDSFRSVASHSAG